MQESIDFRFFLDVFSQKGIIYRSTETISASHSIFLSFTFNIDCINLRLLSDAVVLFTALLKCSDQSKVMFMISTSNFIDDTCSNGSSFIQPLLLPILFLILNYATNIISVFFKLILILLISIHSQICSRSFIISCCNCFVILGSLTTIKALSSATLKTLPCFGTYSKSFNIDKKFSDLKELPCRVCDFVSKIFRAGEWFVSLTRLNMC